MAVHPHPQAHSTPSNLRTAGAWLALIAIVVVVLAVLVGGAVAMNVFAYPL